MALSEASGALASGVWPLIAYEHTLLRAEWNRLT